MEWIPVTRAPAAAARMSARLRPSATASASRDDLAASLSARVKSTEKCTASLQEASATQMALASSESAKGLVRLMLAE